MAKEPKTTTLPMMNEIEDDGVYRVSLNRSVKNGPRPLRPDQIVTIAGAALKKMMAAPENEGAFGGIHKVAT